MTTELVQTSSDVVELTDVEIIAIETYLGTAIETVKANNPDKNCPEIEYENAGRVLFVTQHSELPKSHWTEIGYPALTNMKTFTLAQALIKGYKLVEVKDPIADLAGLYNEYARTEELGVCLGRETATHYSNARYYLRGVDDTFKALGIDKPASFNPRYSH